jgi:hypothetical protein
MRPYMVRKYFAKINLPFLHFPLSKTNSVTNILLNKIKMRAYLVTKYFEKINLPFLSFWKKNVRKKFDHFFIKYF